VILARRVEIPRSASERRRDLELFTQAVANLPNRRFDVGVAGKIREKRDVVFRAQGRQRFPDIVRRRGGRRLRQRAA